jgi:hypothetical protein
MHRFIINNQSILVFLSIFALTFGILFLKNYDYIRTYVVPFSDYASDSLLIKLIPDGKLLFGHHSFIEVNHPGPYFLYMQFLGSLIAKEFSGSAFSGQLLGVFINSALFTAIFGFAIHSIANKYSHYSLTSFLSTIFITSLVFVQLSSDHQSDFSVAVGARVSLADPFMPEALIMPLLALLVSLVLVIEGSPVFFVISAFCTAVLAHGYITMLAIAPITWSVAVILGCHFRKVQGQTGVPKWVWGTCSVIVGIFLLPIILDCIINPPGNILRIIGFAIGQKPSDAQDIVATGWHAKIWSLAHELNSSSKELLAVHWAIISLYVVAQICMRTPNSRNNILYISLFLFAGLLSSLAFLLSPSAPYHYQTHYLIAIPLSLFSFATIVLIAMIERWSRPAILLLTIAALFYMGANARFSTPRLETSFIQNISQHISTEVPPGGHIVIDGRPGFVSSLMIDLERYQIFACAPDPHNVHFFTERRVCKNTNKNIATYKLVIEHNCDNLPSYSTTQEIGGKIKFMFGFKKSCIILTREQ